MKSRSFTFLPAALVAVALAIGTVGINTAANAFTLIELLVAHHTALNFPSASVNPDRQTPQVNVTNVGDEPIKVQIKFYEYDAAGAPSARTSKIYHLTAGYSLREVFPLTRDPRSANPLKHVRPVVMAVTETDEPTNDVVASFELVSQDPNDPTPIGLLLPAVQKVR
ncbi:MAG: hypothetical protein FJ147_05365 [Deltaproteobacteria bacterium]|nr:hypothetical protein [Deltaproteobacteria bacterium]